MYVNITKCFVYTWSKSINRGEDMYKRIRNLREDRDLKQEDMAKLLSCTQACYSNYENGRRDIPTEVLEALADFYNVSVDYLLGRTNVKTPYPKK